MINSDQLDQMQARILSASILQEAILRTLSKEQIEQVKQNYLATSQATDANLHFTGTPDNVIDYVQKLSGMTAQVLDQIAASAKPS